MTHMSTCWQRLAWRSSLRSGREAHYCRRGRLAINETRLTASDQRSVDSRFLRRGGTATADTVLLPHLRGTGLLH